MNTKRDNTSGRNSMSARFCRRIGPTLLTLLAAMALAIAVPARAGTQSAAIPFSDIGARATASYQGDALGVTATADGARLRCGFQKLEGHATTEGLWLQSTKPGDAGRLRVTATAFSRAGLSTLNLQPSTALAVSGTVSLNDKLVRFTRPGLTEEYSVSVDGVRQDFVIESPPLNPQPSTLNQSAGDLRVELTLCGARAEATASSARLRLDGSSRALAYSRLRVEDANGRELAARLEVLSPDRLAVSVADANATYPVRIDPTFSDADWVSLNPGLPGATGNVFAIAADNSGNVYVGGAFIVIGTVVANNVAKWDGTAWSALGSGMSDWVYALAVSGTTLYAGGYFQTAGGVPANRIAKWNGSAWSALGQGMNGGVYALALSGNNLYAGGGFTTAGGVTAHSIAKWDGSVWSALGPGVNGDVRALAASGTNLYAGGTFTTAGGVPANGIAKWDGSAWSALGSGMGGVGYPSVHALAVSGTDLYAGGWFTTAGGVPAPYIAKWNGNAWSTLGSWMNNAVNALAVSGADLYAGGDFDTAGGVPANYIAKWDGSTWSALGSWRGMNDAVLALAVSGTNLYAGGYFTTAGGVTANKIAKWDGSAWSALGSGMNNTVHALAVSGSKLYAGGWFITAGGVPAPYIAKWNGNAWSALGAGMNSVVYALAVSGTNLYAGGAFTTAGGVPANYIAKWDGSAWSALGLGMNGAVYALAVSDADLYAAGVFDKAGEVTVNYIAKWDGSTWSALGSGMDDPVEALAVSGRKVYAGGYFTSAGGVPARRIAKWDGSTWSALGSGMDDQVFDLAADEAGHLFIGGDFSLAGTNGSPFIAQANLGSAPTILRPLPTQTAEAGTTVHLTVDAASDPPPAYQWYFNGTNLLSCASSDLAWTNILFSQSGTYTVVITNVFGVVTSAPVTLNVIAPVVHRLVPGVNLMAQAGNFLGLDYSDELSPTASWETMAVMSLTNASQFCFDLSAPLPSQRFYRAWETGTPSMRPSLDLHLVPAITLTGSIGQSVRVDYINQFGPTDAWVTLDILTLTNTSQLYFDTSSIDQPARLYRVVQMP